MNFHVDNMYSIVPLKHDKWETVNFMTQKWYQTIIKNVIPNKNVGDATKFFEKDTVKKLKRKFVRFLCNEDIIIKPDKVKLLYWDWGFYGLDNKIKGI